MTRRLWLGVTALTSIDEDATGNGGQSVQFPRSTVTDPDSGSQQGIAVTR